MVYKWLNADIFVPTILEDKNSVWSHLNEAYGSVWSPLNWAYSSVRTHLNEAYGFIHFLLIIQTQSALIKFANIGVSDIPLLLCKKNNKKHF